MSLSKNVTPDTLDVMYNNFVKMTDWLINGKNSQYKMPVPYSELWGTVEGLATANEKIIELENTIAELKQKNVQLEISLSNINDLLETLVANQPVTPVVAEPVVEPTPVAPAMVLQDLGEVVTQQPTQAVVEPVAQPTVSPNEQAIQVSAAAIGVGNIDPTSYAALDAEIDNLLKK